MKLKPYKDVMVELTNNGWEVSIGDFEGTDDDWEYELATFKYKNHALKWALKLFLKVSDDDKQFTLLDYENPTMEFKVYDKQDLIPYLPFINLGDFSCLE
jgi:hypothetical protein